jgi:phosphoglycolate phosphatase-like HAD superfamily hydrolase
MVGDKKIDVETGQAAGIRTIMVMTGYGREHIDELTTAPDLTAKNLKEAADLILDSGDLA